MESQPQRNYRYTSFPESQRLLGGSWAAWGRGHYPTAAPELPKRVGAMLASYSPRRDPNPGTEHRDVPGHGKRFRSDTGQAIVFLAACPMCGVANKANAAAERVFRSKLPACCAVQVQGKLTQPMLATENPHLFGLVSGPFLSQRRSEADHAKSFFPCRARPQ